MKFSLGQVVGTPAALKALEEAGITPGLLLLQHQMGLWGDLSPEDKQANERAIQDGSRIVSKYRVGRESVYVISEAEDDNGVRQSTCILLTHEY